MFFVDAIKKGEKLKNQKQINKRIKRKMSKLLSKANELILRHALVPKLNNQMRMSKFSRYNLL